ncbi:hypothetical protein [Mycetocola zhadangensis]|uniref:Uncharacterized protein n=1 Tax=Mycetocola zhadangensis TaxID=1164595 RepID=A0A3L7J7F9_9MICO|nr:hypothetical protein [Mycetocola zhadangensis]RLQ86354.1 hypothetical protein D9V28_05920 [Mycetocola zhadangensis]GGE90455.1 hypothetical protein GCM10011313_11690 [Mycetocola zhadangensis]
MAQPEACWLGIVLLVLGTVGANALITGSIALGGQELASSWPIWTLNSVLSLMVPLGAGFVVASIVARAIGEKRFSRQAESTDESRLPPRLSPRFAVLLGTGLIAIAIVDQNLLFFQYIPDRPGVEQDVLRILAPLLGVLSPVGAALIPGGWLLARVAASSVPAPNATGTATAPTV